MAKYEYTPEYQIGYNEGLEAAEAERDRLAARVAEVEKALDDVDAPVTDQHLGGLAARMGEEDGGYSLAGRIRALYSRERIDANRQRARVAELERDIGAVRAAKAEWKAEYSKCDGELEQTEAALDRAQEALREIDAASDLFKARYLARRALAALAGEDDGPPQPQREGDYL